LARRVDAGSLTPVSRDVLAVSGAPRTAQQRVMAAVLESGDGALASHRTAAALWQLPGFDFQQLEVTMGGRRSSRVRHLAFRHRPVLLLSQHQTSVDGIPCTSLARTIFDLAASGVSSARLERIVNLAVNRSPGTLTALHRTLDELARRGRPGITVMRAILDERPVGSRLPQSGLEMRFEKILHEFGEPPLERQVDLGGHEWLGRVDFLDRSILLIVEVDSILHHTSPFDRARDAARDAELLGAGFRQVLRVPEEHVWYEPHLAASAVRDARRTLRAAA
jgi:very-short-patch-repair endonuclease